MGLARWIQQRDLKKTLHAIEGFPEEILEDILTILPMAAGKIEIRLRMPILDILNSEGLHIVEDQNWANAPLAISTNLRIPLIHSIRAGKVEDFPMYMAVSVLLHSVRAVLDYELHNNKKLHFLCQTMWYALDPSKKETPSRFR